MITSSLSFSGCLWQFLKKMPLCLAEILCSQQWDGRTVWEKSASGHSCCQHRDNNLDQPMSLPSTQLRKMLNLGVVHVHSATTQLCCQWSLMELQKNRRKIPLLPKKAGRLPLGYHYKRDIFNCTSCFQHTSNSKHLYFLLLLLIFNPWSFYVFKTFPEN